MKAGAIGLYEEALRMPGPALMLRTAVGHALPMQVERWCGPPDGADEELLRRCRGPVLDIGCGPGRLTIALAERGIPVLGVDISGTAVARIRRAGASALHRSVFDPLPGQGRWVTALRLRRVPGTPALLPVSQPGPSAAPGPPRGADQDPGGKPPVRSA
jgi:SAM-dependent methyltransferase